TAGLHVPRAADRKVLDASARRRRRQPVHRPHVIAAALHWDADRRGAAMNDMGRPVAWCDANQKLVALELLLLKQRLAPETGDPAEIDSRIVAAKAAMPSPPAIDLIVEAFSLSPFERSLLLLCAGVEMDAQFAAACATASGRPTFALALSVLDDPHWSALTPTSPLRLGRLIEIEPGHALTMAPLRLDERILHFLAGINILDPRLQPLLATYEPPRLMARHQQMLADKLAVAWAQAAVPRPPIHLTGEDLLGTEDVAAAAAARLGLQLRVARADTLPVSAVELGSFIALWEREAALLPAALLVKWGDSPTHPQIQTMAERIRAPLLISARDPLRLRRPMLSFEVGKPDAPEQKRLWQLVLGIDSGALNGALDGVTSQFRLSARTIALAGIGVSEQVAAGEPAAKAVWRACRDSGRSRLDELAQHIP